MAVLKHTTVGFGLGLLLLILVGAYSLRTLSQTAVHHRWVIHTLEVKESLKGFAAALSETEAARRGYGLSGDEADLQRFGKAEPLVLVRFRSLRRLTSDNPAQAERLGSLETLVSERLALLHEAIALQRSQGRSAPTLSAITARGQASMDAIQALLSLVEREEDTLLVSRQQKALASANQARVVIAAGTAVALAIVAVVSLFAERERRERSAAEAALRASEARQRAILDNTTAFVYLKDLDGRFLLANRSFGALFPAGATSLVGKSDHDLFDAAAADALRRNDLKVLEARQALEFEEALPRPEGVRTCLSVKFPLLGPDGAPYAVGGISTDVTERRRLENERNLLFELSEDLIYIGATDRSFQRLNPAWERVLGHDAATLASRPALEWVHPEERESTRVSSDAVGHGGPAQTAMENRMLCADGSYRWVQWSIQADRERGLTFAIGRDVTDQKGFLEEMRRAREATEAANSELEAFSYSVSHDLRAPLRHIDGFVDLLRKKTASGLDDTSRRYLDVISEAARKMGALIDDLLSFSRMGRSEMARADVDLNQVLEEVVADARADANGRDIAWTLAPLPRVRGDRAMLRVVLENLVSNAVKYTRRRDKAHIEVGSSSRNGRAVIFVRDDGAGFDMKYADKLFGVFQRLHRAEDFEGTGIGLATVRRIVHRHAGQAWAEGSPEQGATFYVSLPASEGRET